MRFLLLFLFVPIISCDTDKKTPASVQTKDPDSNAQAGPELPTIDTSRLKDIANWPPTLSITPLDVSGDLGQITFTRNDSTFFYYRNARGGKIKLDGKEYKINRLSYDKKYGYLLSGEDDLLIAMTGGTFKENNGEDCAYGSFPEVNISIGKARLTLYNITVQDCPSY